MCERIGLSSPRFESSGEGLLAAPAGVAMFSAMRKSSRFMGSEAAMFCSDDFRNWAIPLGAFPPDLCEENDKLAPYRPFAWRGRALHGGDPLLASRRYRSRQPYLEDSSLASRCLRRLACIMRHVRFSMRSWLGKLCFVLLKKRQTWAASGSSLPSSPGLVLIPAMPSWKPAKASVLDSVPRALSKVFERSKRTSLRLPRISAAFLGLLVLVLGLWALLRLPWAINEAVPVLLLVLAGAERSDCSGLMSPGPLSAGLRGNRKSCSVEVGLIEVRGLDVDMAAMSYGRV